MLWFSFWYLLCIYYWFLLCDHDEAYINILYIWHKADNNLILIAYKNSTLLFPPTLLCFWCHNWPLFYIVYSLAYYCNYSFLVLVKNFILKWLTYHITVLEYSDVDKSLPLLVCCIFSYIFLLLISFLSLSIEEKIF